MGYALERFGDRMSALAPDMEGVALFGSALGDLTAYAEGAYGALHTVITASETVIGAFDRMGDEVAGTYQHIGEGAADLGTRLPGYFRGPLREIAGMFASMAASARASMNGIAASARTALQAVSAVSTASGAVGMSAPGRPQMLSVGNSVSLLSTPDREALRLPEPQIFLSGASGAVALQTTVAVTVQNENHISSEVDAETVLREMEVRLADAVASSMEGVYA